MSFITSTFIYLMKSWRLFLCALKLRNNEREIEGNKSYSKEQQIGLTPQQQFYGKQ